MEYFRVERTDGVAVCAMHNPPMNYLTGPMTQELGQLVVEVASDRSVRSIVFTGGVAGKFITHYSVEELAYLAADPDLYRQRGADGEAAFHALLSAVQRLPKPVTAGVNGAW